MQRLKEIVGVAPKLELKVLSSAFLEKGEILLINALGLENIKTKRGAKDGFTYFGCKKSIKKIVRTQPTMQVGITGASLDEED